MKILIAGGTGFVGNHLRQHVLSNYHEVYLLSRRKSGSEDSKTIVWDPSKAILESLPNFKFDVIINLSGENIGEKYWTKKQKEKILTSRIESTQFLNKLLTDGSLKADYFLQASAIGIYGDRGKEKLSEESDSGDGFLAHVVKEWEQAAADIQLKKSILRFGIVFHSHEGAFKKLILGLKFRICLIFGNGLNYISWIDIDDLCRMIIFLIEHKKTGVYNAVSPQPIQNLFLLKKYNKMFGGLSMTIQIPSFVLRWILGEFSELFLFSQRVSSRKIEMEGFEFQVRTFKDFLKKYTKKFN